MSWSKRGGELISSGAASARARSLQRFIDAFVPANPPVDVERVRLAIAVCWLMVPVFLLLAGAHSLAGAHREALINVVLALVMAGSPAALRLVGRYGLMLNTVLALAGIAVAAIAVVERGAGITAASVALAELPLFATLLGGIRTGAVWAVIAGAAIIALGVLGATGVAIERTPIETRWFDEHAALLVITGTLFFVAIMYELNKQRSFQRIALLEQHRSQVEREKVEAQAEVRVARAERLASLGRIAAAVAHEINNPLSYVASNIEYARRELAHAESDPGLGEALRDCMDGIERIRRIVADLRSYTSADDAGLTSVDVTRALHTALKMAEGHTRTKATVERDMPEVSRVVGNETRLVQVFLNLIVNAAQALPEGRALQNRIRVRVREAGDSVLVEIEDTGPGIPHDVLHRMTDPFFTTKPAGEGMGLGLALSKSMLEAAGGKLEFESEPGTTIARVWLAQSHEASTLTPIVSTMLPPANDEVPAELLVIDDEPLVGRGLQRSLKPHHVTAVTSGRAALELLSQGRHFDLILCDMMMPDLSGMDVYALVRERRPALLDRIVFMSGGTFTEHAEEFRASVANVFLDKPLNTPKLRALIAAGQFVPSERRPSQTG